MPVKYLLDDRQAKDLWEDIRSGKHPAQWGNFPYGVDIMTTVRKVTCRACGQEIPKGVEAVNFGWDFHGNGSITSTTGWMHKEPCL